MLTLSPHQQQFIKEHCSIDKVTVENSESFFSNDKYNYSINLKVVLGTTLILSKYHRMGGGGTYGCTKEGFIFDSIDIDEISDDFNKLSDFYDGVKINAANVANTLLHLEPKDYTTVDSVKEYYYTRFPKSNYLNVYPSDDYFTSLIENGLKHRDSSLGRLLLIIEDEKLNEEIRDALLQTRRTVTIEDNIINIVHCQHWELMKVVPELAEVFKLDYKKMYTGSDKLHIVQLYKSKLKGL